ncbi:MAG: 1-acyl-sn-glycerol-3-phosphate acyltransferase [Acidobacteria bacterium]|nr:1-acyl-sn-glycerol-3-phosphate acyltransferase [Acidobacteriota bacterium]
MALFILNRNGAPNFPSPMVFEPLRYFALGISKLLWFIRYRGKENIPSVSEGPFLIAANHQTYFDPAWICAPVKTKFRFMAWDRAFEWRFVGWFIRSLGAFPVSLEKGGSLSALKEALATFKAGGALVIFPEGAREFSDGRLLGFKQGAVRIAMQANVPILPVTIRGGNRVWPQKQKYPKFFRPIVVKYHPLLHIEKNGLDENEAAERYTRILSEIIADTTDG